MKIPALFASLCLYGVLSSVPLYSYANTTYWGTAVPIGNGQARSYVEVDDDEMPMALGLALSGAALEGLPSTEHMYDYILSLPEDFKLPPFEHVMINWNPHGHEPTEIYGAPHFDFHFYTISNEDRLKITCTGDDQNVCIKMPAADYIPPYYAATPAGVPQMGWHWYDPRSPEFHGQPFTSTFIYGFYNAQMIFLEPMITRDFLLSKGTVDADIPMPAKVNKSGLYPGHYSLNYDAVQDLYLIALKKFSDMEATR